MIEAISTTETLQQKGYVNVEIDLSRAEMQTAINQYMAFLAIDPIFHEKTQFWLSDRGDGDYGQFTRIAGMDGERGKIQDNKDIFHFGSMTRQVVETRVSGKLPKEMKDFLNSAEEIFWTAERSKKQVLESFVGKSLLRIMQTEDDTLNDVLRFIAYYPNKEKLAQGHFDRSTATLAIGESHEGLRIAPGQNGMVINADQKYMDKLENNLQPVEHREGEAKFFLGAGWNRLYKEHRNGLEKLPLGWHDVIPSDSNKKVDKRIMRWAIVLFMNPYTEFVGDGTGYTVPTPPETRPQKKLGTLTRRDLYAYKRLGRWPTQRDL